MDFGSMRNVNSKLFVLVESHGKMVQENLGCQKNLPQVTCYDVIEIPIGKIFFFEILKNNLWQSKEG